MMGWVRTMPVASQPAGSMSWAPPQSLLERQTTAPTLDTTAQWGAGWSAGLGSAYTPHTVRASPADRVMKKQEVTA